MSATVGSNRSPNRGETTKIVATTQEVRHDPDGSLGGRIRDALSRSGYGSLGTISANVRDGIVHLTGTVGSWYLRQVAQEIVMKITGRGCIRNNLDVVYGETRQC